MINLSSIKKYYLSSGVLEEINRVGEEREVVPVYKAKFYGKRPSYMPYITDYKIAVSEGATSFHMSVERWRNVLDLEKAKDNKLALNELRIGWDLIFDIDAKEGKEGIKYAAVTAEEIIKFLQEEGVKNIYVKFSGSRGFHIAVNGKAFPPKILSKPIAHHYPELLHKIVFYIKQKITPLLNNKLKHEFDVSKNYEELVEIEGNWSYRHLFRAPYSLNEKTWLISIPLFFYQLKRFDTSMAEIDNFKGVRIKFLEKWQENELELLALNALEYAESEEYKKEREKFLKEAIEKRKKGELTHIQDIHQEINKTKKLLIKRKGKAYVSEEHFPPCIKAMLQGLEDGRKRALFVLLNFLQKAGWNIEAIEERIKEWNMKNKEPLKDSYINAQINYFKKHFNKIKEIPPPNCDNQDYYKDLGVCLKGKDKRCEPIKNPIVYAYKQAYLARDKYENTHKRNTRSRKNDN